MGKYLVPGLVGAFLLAGCASKGGWMGAAAEKQYDKDLAAQRLAETYNNDDYYEFEHDGRLHVLSDAKDYTVFRQTGEVVFSVKKIGGGPDGRTVVFGLTKAETKKLEKNPQFVGGAQAMFEGKVEGITKGFFGIVEKDGRYFVFEDWKDFKAFRATGEAAYGLTRIGAGPDGKTVVFVQNNKSAQNKPEAAMERFRKLMS